jgi:predicted dehydrogenase
MSNVIKVGVIGVGKLGVHHAGKYAEIEGADLVGVYDVRSERAEEIARKYSTAPYASIEELISKVDAVSVVVPTTGHYEVASLCLKNDVHVLVEKPFTYTLTEAEELVSMSRKKKITLQVGHVERFNSAIISIQKLLKNPKFIESHRLGPYDGRVQDVGVVLDLMMHDLDIVTELVGQEVNSIDATGVCIFTNNEDIANARLKFPRGCVANLIASRISAERMRKIRIFQEDTYISIDFLNQAVDVYCVERPGKPHPVDVANLGEPIQTFSDPGTNVTISVYKLDIAKGDSLRRELESFLNCVRTGTKPVVSGEKGMEMLSLALQICEQIHAD